MATIKCKGCGVEHAAWLKKCIYCGYSKDAGGGPVVLVILIIVGAIFYWTYSPTPPPVPPSAAEIAAKEKKEQAFQKVVVAMKLLRGGLRNPDSLKWESVHANDDASIICLEYRAQNGFGGMNKEFMVFAKNTASQAPEIWNRNCNKPLGDMIYARNAL